VALNADSSKTVKATDFKFDTRCFQCHDPLKFVEKGHDQDNMTPEFFLIHLAEQCTLTSAF